VSATFSIVRAAPTEGARAFSRLFSACRYAIARCFTRRAATASLRELNDELPDIGLLPSQIEPAARGFINFSNRARMS